MCQIWGVVDLIFRAYLILMLIYAVMSWVPSLRGRWTDYVSMLVEPVLVPIRRIIPPVAGLDLSFLIVIILLQIVDSNIVQPQRFTACSFY